MTPDTERLEREYSPRLSVPNHTEYFAAWPADSAAAREKLKGHLDLAYGPHPGERLDLFVAGRARGLVVFIHGGYWRAFDKSDFSFVAPSLIEAGFDVAVLNYALCPVVPMGEIVEQCRRGVAWLHRHAGAYGADPSRLMVCGHSAGAHLTAMLYTADWAAYGLPEGAIVGGIALSGLFDLEPLLSLAINADLRLDPPQVAALSPALLSPRLEVPLVVGAGALESEEFKRQSRILLPAWPAVATPSLEIEGRHHFDILEPLMDTESEVWREFWRRVGA
ncbi:MAG: alpha/beta hydrolase [Meiothermus sp.]|nr:alpha/beta hydrolase [Meiothermus sp.]